METETKTYAYGDYAIVLSRENEVIYYSVYKDSEPVASGFVPTNESFYQFMQGIKLDIETGTLVGVGNG